MVLGTYVCIVFTTNERMTDVVLGTYVCIVFTTGHRRINLEPEVLGTYVCVVFTTGALGSKVVYGIRHLCLHSV